MSKRHILLTIVVLLGLLCSTGIGQAQASTGGTWGESTFEQTSVPASLTDATAIVAGAGHSLALRSDGTVAGWGDNSYGQINVAGLSGVTAIAAGWNHSLALKGDGTVVAWGDNPFGQTTVPTDLSNVIAIAAGQNHSLALKGDGTVVVFGGEEYHGQATVPTEANGAIAIAAGGYHSLALKSDGTVVAWGDNAYEQATVPPDLTNVAAISAGAYHNLALMSDGTVRAWGVNFDGQATVPAGLSNVIAVDAGAYFSLALKSDGTVVAWGCNDELQLNVPAGLTDVFAISAGGYHGLALTTGPVATVPIVTTHPQSQSVYVGDTASFSAAAGGEPAPTLQWQMSTDNGANWTELGASVSPLTFSAAFGQNGSQYRAVFTNSAGSATSAAATLTVSKRPASVTLSDLTQTFDGEIKSVTVDTNPTQLPVQVTYNGDEGLMPAQAGTYAVVATINDAFFEGSASDTLTILPKPASVTPAAAGKVYGEADPVLTGTLDGFLPTDTDCNLSADCVRARFDREAGEGVGDYLIRASVWSMNPDWNPLDNYAITHNTANFRIEPRPIQVTAEAKAKIAGEPDPPLTYQVTSGSLAFADVFSGELARDAGEEAGVYPIRQGTLALGDNYSLAYVGADLTIISAQVPAPVLTSVSPMAAVAGTDVLLTVSGSDFVAGSSVRWNGADLMTTFVSTAQLTAIIPASELAAVQTAQVTVFTPEPGGGTSSVLAFFVTDGAAGVTDQDVASGDDKTASAGAATATASGEGLLVVAQYDANPGGTPGFTASSAFFDVYAAPGNSFTEVVISACGLSAADKLYWWDAGLENWVKAEPQSYDATNGCVTLTVTASSSPTLGQLAGTAFAAGADTNAAPVAAPGGPYLGAINTAIAFDGSASSDADGDLFTFAWAFGDGANGSGVAPAHSYAAAGIYNVCLTVNDVAVDSTPVCTMAVAYDPSAGFVTGGGWILSPAGAYKPDTDLSGSATFGFVSKYKKGASAPEGGSEFAFEAAGFNFTSTAYEWLVVSKDQATAQFKGAGTVNGALDPNGNAYKFMLWAGDGTGGEGADTFRIRIWWEGVDGVHDVYDNGIVQEISGGNILVHTGRVKSTSLAEPVSQVDLLYLPMINAD